MQTIKLFSLQLFKRLMQHRAARYSLIVLFIFYFSALFADFLSPYHYDDEDRALSYCPPMKIHFSDINGNFSIRPFVYAYAFEFDEMFKRVYVENKKEKHPLQFFIRTEPYKMWGVVPLKWRLFGVKQPGRLYLLGADRVGRDLLSRIIYGARVSLSIGLVGALLTLMLGMLIGGISGYFGGKTDQILMRLSEVFMMVPSFYFMLALRASFPTTLSSTEIYLLLIVILSFIGWAGLARVVRGLALSIREKDFVRASRLMGRSHFYTIVKHILPNTFSYVIVATTLAIPGYILGESSLSLLGLGIQDPHASWGNLLSDAMNISEIKFHPWILIPGLLISVVVMAFSFLGDGLRDILDPKMQIEKKRFI